MSLVREKLIAFWKRETVLCIAAVLAMGSMCVIPPDGEYFSYIDFRTLAILFCLMSVMAGLQSLGLFERIAGSLLNRVHGTRQVIGILMLLCFFFSMVITNDVALITFVPFSFSVLELLGTEKRRRLILPVVVLQTIAANLGSMLTPIGNPQNLYLYGKAGVGPGTFIGWMLPYALCSLILLLLCVCFLGREKGQPSPEGERMFGTGKELGQLAAGKYILYALLFGLSILTVARLLPYGVPLVAVLLALLLWDRHVLAKVDYCLLLTFVAFFIFIGNMGRLPAFREFLQQVIHGREVYTGVIASQVISNVPAALLLSGFTENLRDLVVGVNLGGLGTLIASMASLISYKFIAREEGARKGSYIGLFTVANVGFLAVLLIFHAVIG